MKMRLICIAVLTLAGQFAAAEDLMDVYNLAVKNDQQFQNATATRQATAEALPQAMAALFPNISATANSTMNRNETTHDVTPSQNGLLKYNNHGYTLSATLPLINFTNWFTVGQAKATVKQADATYGAAAQDLIIRTAQAYFNVLLAEDNLQLIKAQKDTVAKQLAQAKARFEVGVDAISSVYNAEASYDSLVAQEMTAQNNLATSYQNLNVITGKHVDQLNKVMKDLPLLQPVPNDLTVWQDASEKRNLSLLALRYTADAAREGIKVQASGHLPTLSAVGSYGYNQESPNANNPGMHLTNVTQQAGVQLAIPLFAGGAVLSQTRQAQDEFVEATTNMELLHRQVLAQVTQSYSTVLTSISQIEADRATIKAKQNALDSNQAAYQAGTMTILDVLTAIQDLYNAQKVYYADQYNYLLNTLQLKELAGNLSNVDVTNINKWMQGNGQTTSAQVIKDIASHVRDISNVKNAGKVKIDDSDDDTPKSKSVAKAPAAKANTTKTTG